MSATERSVEPIPAAQSFAPNPQLSNAIDQDNLLNTSAAAIIVPEQVSRYHTYSEPALRIN